MHYIIWGLLISRFKFIQLTTYHIDWQLTNMKYYLIYDEKYYKYFNLAVKLGKLVFANTDTWYLAYMCSNNQQKWIGIFLKLRLLFYFGCEYSIRCVLPDAVIMYM